MTTTKLGVAAHAHLLAIARESLRQFILKRQLYRPPLARLSPRLRAPGACFVTLCRQGQLRGCIGSTERRRPLALDVAHNAAAAARDSRFPPVLPCELGAISVELSVLGLPCSLAYGDYKDLVGKLRPGRDGVIISWQERRALLLPQVWARLPEPAAFLAALCHKAQIPLTILRTVPPTVTVLTFEADSFKEYDDNESGRI